MMMIMMDQVQSPAPASTEAAGAATSEAGKSSTLPWSYSSKSYQVMIMMMIMKMIMRMIIMMFSFQPLNFTNPFSSHSSREREHSTGRAPGLTSSSVR